MVELEFLRAMIARTTEELNILESQMAVAESRVRSSADDLTRVSESYVKPSYSTDQRPHYPSLENNAALTTIFFQGYLNPRSTATDSPKSSTRSIAPSSLFGRAERSISTSSSSAKPPSLALLSKEVHTDMKMPGRQTSKSVK